MLTGRTVGAAIGAVLFVLFFSMLASRLMTPASNTPEHKVASAIR